MRTETELRILRLCREFKELVGKRELYDAIHCLLEDREPVFHLLTELDVVSELVLDEEPE